MLRWDFAKRAPVTTKSDYRQPEENNETSIVEIKPDD